jgi:gamma-glutamylcyclotransferase (GGCT)/AIG2-like uncharacterized protein YtfP
LLAAGLSKPAGPGYARTVQAAVREVLLFVYGTLLRGEESHALLEGSRLVREVKTAPKYSLVDLGTYPGMVKGGDVAISGELFVLEIPTLAKVDVHEGHPVLFKRQEVELDDGSHAHAYLLDLDQVRGRRRIRGGSWKDRGKKVMPEGTSARDTPFVRWSKSRPR